MTSKKLPEKTISKIEWETLYSSITHTHWICQAPVGDDLHVITRLSENGRTIRSTEKQFMVKDCKPIGLSK